MATTISISYFTPTTLFYFLLLSTSHFPILAINITHLLSSYPDLSDFTNLLSTTSVAADLAQRSSVTILAVPNTFLRSSDLINNRPPSSSSVNLADVLRYHVLLEYFSWPDLRLIPPTGKLITTLFQTTGRAPNNFGYVNITRDPTSNAITIHSSNSNATIISLVKTLPYNISIFTVDSVLIPNGFNLMASETRPPLGLNITKTLIDGHNFNVAASMLTASGVEQEFEDDEGGAGITLFVPTDQAFSDLKSSVRFQSLSAEKKADVLRFHVLHSYYPLGSLQSIVNPVQPTLATEKNGAGSFTLNISRVNGSVAIDTGIVQASVTRTVFDQNPVAIFGVSTVLLPREFFGKNPIEVNKPSGGVAGLAGPPEISLSPDNSPDIDGSASHLSSPPGLGNKGTAAAANRISVVRIILGLWCIGFYLLVIN
ncbi:fasciclin-like arabinogalactan protein 4 [Nicotiana tabacum]|uniref:Fasciclin-like arabinogalactan protein 4 n=1 Tax=Nicotiana tabacum TaxID=4097 RepID=A0A1S3ZZ38_TOBAC|nr:fasciclin-like arabinogalactan protein 4 [Nicotiana tomentosiformis]